MSAIPNDLLHTTERLSSELTRPLPGSRKVFVQGSRADLRVALREVMQSDTASSGAPALNPVIPIYDTSGPYTDPAARNDLALGLHPLRSAWIEERGDTEPLSGPSSRFGHARRGDPSTAALRFPHMPRLRRARAGQCVTQLHYARKGIVTPEM